MRPSWPLRPRWRLCWPLWRLSCPLYPPSHRWPPAGLCPPQVDAALVQQACDELRGLLAMDSPAAVACLDRHSALLLAALGPEFRPVKLAIRSMDFEQALTSLDHLLATQAATPSEPA